MGSEPAKLYARENKIQGYFISESPVRWRGYYAGKMAQSP